MIYYLKLRKGKNLCRRRYLGGDASWMRLFQGAAAHNKYAFIDLILSIASFTLKNSVNLDVGPPVGAGTDGGAGEERER